MRQAQPNPEPHSPGSTGPLLTEGCGVPGHPHQSDVLEVLARDCCWHSDSPRPPQPWVAETLISEGLGPAGQTHLGPRFLHVAFLQVVPGELRYQLGQKTGSGLGPPSHSPPVRPRPPPPSPRLAVAELTCPRRREGGMWRPLASPLAPADTSHQHLRRHRWPRGRPPAGSGSGRLGAR